MKIGSIKISRFDEGLTVFKPDYYLNRGKKIISDLIDKKVNYSSLLEVTDKLYQGGIFKRVFVEHDEYAHKYITASDMVKSQPLESAKKISIKYTPWVDDMTLRDKQVLVSCAGTVGNTVLVNNSFSGCIGSQEIIRIETSKVPYGFLYAYINSPIVNEYIQSMIYGAVVPRISPKELGSLPVLLPNKALQEQIHENIVIANDLRYEANKLLKEAIELISENFESIDRKKESFIGKTSILNLVNNYQKRLNSPAYINNGVKILEALTNKGFNFKTISDLNFKVYRPGIFKRIKVSNQNGLPYIKGSELNKINPFNSCEYLSKTKTPFLEELALKDGQILFTCAGTVGDIKLITKEYEEKKAVGSQDIIRIEKGESEISMEYLYAYLKTELIHEYIQSLKYGSVIERVEPFHVDLIPVFIPQKEVYEKVTLSVNKYKDFIYKAFKREEYALSLIEKEIESWQKS